MRVLQVYKTSFPEVRGGVDVVVSNLLRHSGDGIDSLLLRTAEWTLRGVDTTAIDGIDVLALHLPVPPARMRDFKSWMFLIARAPRALLHLRRLLRQRAIDLVHLHTLQFYQIYFVLCRWLGGPPFIITLHRAEVLGYAACHPLLRGIWRLGLSNAAAVNAVSAWLTSTAKRTFPFLDTIHCITNGIDLPPTPPSAGAALRRDFGIPARYYVMLGTLEAYKGHDIALRAWAGLATDSALVIIGAGSARAAYATLCRELGIAERVYFTGQLPREQALALLSDSQAMIMPSRSEGLGLAVLEAGVVGIAVIASDIGPFREMIAPDRTGLLFACGDVEALRAAVRRLDADAVLRARLASAFSAHVRSHCSFAITARRYAELYRAAVAGNGRTPLS